MIRSFSEPSGSHSGLQGCRRLARLLLGEGGVHAEQVASLLHNNRLTFTPMGNLEKQISLTGIICGCKLESSKKKKENMQLHKEGSSWDSNLWGESANHCPLCNLIFDSLNKKKMSTS